MKPLAPPDERRIVKTNLTVTPVEREIIRKAAEAAGLPFATWMRLTLMQEAGRLLGPDEAGQFYQAGRAVGLALKKAGARG